MDVPTDQGIPHDRPEAPTCSSAGFTLDPARGVLLRPDGSRVGLRPKTVELLCHLARQAGHVVPRDALMDAVWPGTAVTDDSITQCVVEIRRALGDEGARLLRTLPRRGYVLAAEIVREGTLPPPVMATPGAAALPHGAPDAGGNPSSASRPRRVPLLAGTALAAAALAGAASVWTLSRPAPVPALPPAASAAKAPAAPALPRFSVVVLPFLNRGGDPEQDYLAAVVTEDLTTILGRLAGSFVIGRGTAATYRGRTVDARQLGRELGVRYAVEGSVRRMGEQVRVDAQLLDTGSGAQLWAESLEEPRADLAELSRQVMLRIARALDLQLLAAEGRRLAAERPDNPEAADLVLRGRALMTTFRSRESLAEARRLFERAVALDENSAIAHAGLASAIYDPVTFAWSKDPEADTRLAEAHVMRALAIDRDHAWARRVRGMILERRWRFEEALAEFDRVIAFDPSSVAARVRRGYVKLKTDRPAEAIADISEALRISPRDWNLDTFHHFLASAFLMLGRDEEALEHFLKARAANPLLPRHLFNLASGYALTGRDEEARATLEEHRRVSPVPGSARMARRSWYPDSDYPLYRATRERQIEALRTVGMPEE